MSTPAEKVLSSEWGNLSPHLIASFYEVERQNTDPKKPVTYVKKKDSPVVKAPLTDSNLELSLQWQSPFEQADQGGFATLRQLIQSGQASPVLKNIDNALGTNLQSSAEELFGRTNITKLNSTQIFFGEPPMKFNVTVQLRAWSNPQKEVHEPFNQLVKWALPVELAQDGILLSRLVDSRNPNAVLPSAQPVLIAVNYKGFTFLPMVIESVQIPTNSPVEANGKFVELQIPMVLSTLTAIDRKDWQQFTG